MDVWKTLQDMTKKEAKYLYGEMIMISLNAEYAAKQALKLKVRLQRAIDKVSKATKRRRLWKKLNKLKTRK